MKLKKLALPILMKALHVLNTLCGCPQLILQEILLEGRKHQKNLSNESLHTENLCKMVRHRYSAFLWGKCGPILEMMYRGGKNGINRHMSYLSLRISRFFLFSSAKLHCFISTVSFTFSSICGQANHTTNSYNFPLSEGMNALYCRAMQITTFQNFLGTLQESQRVRSRVRTSWPDNAPCDIP
jgi:hypothetical protein